MSSKLVKAAKVIKKEERKIVTMATPSLSPIEPIEEKATDPFLQEREMMLADIEVEIEKRRNQAEAKLQEWRNKEEEQFHIYLKDMEQETYQKGYTTGMEEGQKQFEDKIAQASSVLQQAYEEKEKLIKEAEPFVLSLTIEIAKKILQQELSQNEEALIHMIKQTLLTIHDASSISIGVAPKDFDFVQKQRQQLLAVMDGQVEVKVFPDYSISDGGCRILTPYGSIDARIDVQLEEIKKALLSCKQVERDE